MYNPPGNSGKDNYTRGNDIQASSSNHKRNSYITDIRGLTLNPMSLTQMCNPILSEDKVNVIADTLKL